MTNAALHFPELDLRELNEYLDAGRYVSAYRTTEAYWGSRERASELDADQVVVAARLAANLGNGKLSRWLVRTGREKFPEHDGVALYASFYAPRREHPLDRLREFERQENTPRFEDPVLQASWLALAAMHWAAVRDMPRAHRLLATADALGGDRAYTWVARAQVLLMEDEWEAALESAERAWTMASGRASVAGTLSRVLSRAGRVEEAAKRLAEVAQRGESFEVAAEAIRYALCMAEHSEGDERAHWCGQAQSMSDSLPGRMPIPDRYARRLLDHVRFDVAHFSGDRDTLESVSREAVTPFLRTLAKDILAKEGPRITTLPLTPMRQKHNTCLPTAIGSLLGGRGITIDVDALVREVSYGGTSSWRAIEWLEQRGHSAHPVLLNRTIVTTLIEAGHPFIFITANLENSHAMTAFGLDYAADCLLVHDPSGLRWVRYNLDQFTDFEAPLGPEGILIGTPEEVDRALALIPPENAAAARLYLEYGKQLEVSGTLSADAARKALEKAFPSHPLSYYVRALQLRNLGRGREALKILQELLKRYPRCERLQSALLSVLDSAGDAVRQREALEEIVDGARLPGVQMDQEWRRPPTTFVLQYAQLIGRSEDKIPKAQRLLRHAIAWNPGNARGYYGVGALLSRVGDAEASLLPLQIAAALEPEDAQFARLVMHVLSGLGREEEGFALLRRRAERLSIAARGGEAWTALVEAYETYGYPEEANALLVECIAAHPDNEVLLAFAVQFWSDSGDWNHAARALDRLEQGGHTLLHLQAASHFHMRSGDRVRAKHFVSAWLKEAPLAGDARQLRLNLTTMESGQVAGLELVQAWLKQQPDNEYLEQMIYDVYRRLHDNAAIDALVDRCIARDADDAWAWRERAFRLLVKMKNLPSAKRETLMAPFQEALDACTRTCPENSGTYFLRAQFAALDGRPVEAADLYLQGIDRDPSMLRFVEEVGEVIPRLPREERRAMLDRLEGVLLRTPGRLTSAWEVSVQYALHLGFAEAEGAVTRWGENRGRDPRLIEAHANLLLGFGGGKSDARKALELLQDGITRFPAEPELRFLLARCFSILEETEEEEKVCRELMRRAPADLRPRFRLARLLEVRGEDTEALALLESCLGLDPANGVARESHATFLWEHGQPIEAIVALEEALILIPESVRLREMIIDFHANMGNERQAMREVEDALAQFPDGAYIWYLRGTVIQRCGQHRDLRQIEESFRKALEFNASLVDACDALAVLLCETRRHQEAHEVLQAQRALVSDDVPLRGRIAWVRYEQDDKHGAIHEMGQLIKEEPLYGWGWRMLISWISEDSKRELAREILPGIHAALPGDPYLRGLALETLTRLEAEEDLYRNDWEQLLADFPKEQAIYMMRFDLLIEWKRFAEARTLLDAAAKYYASSPYVCARDVRLSLAEGNPTRALESARTVWTHPADDTRWPEGTAWSALAGAGHADKASAIITSSIAADYRVGTTAFAHACDHLQNAGWDLWGRGRFWKQEQNPALSMWLPGKPAQRLLNLLRQLDVVSWEADEHRAIVLNTLNDTGYGRSVYRWYQGNEYRVENSPMLWEAVGIALVRCRPKFKYWLRYFQNWQDKPGISLRCAAFYVIALQHCTWGKARQRAHAEKMHENARDALERLPHDHTARYLACVVAATHLQLENWQGFREFMERHGELIRNSGEGDGFVGAARYTHVPELLEHFKSLMRLSGPDTKAIHALSDKVGRIVPLRTCPNWTSDAWHRCVAAHYPEVRLNRRLWWGIQRFYSG